MKPMLAHTVEDASKIVFPVLASPKLDGIRCLMIDGAAHSRNLKLIPNQFIQRKLSGLKGLDGELIVGHPRGEGVFNRSTSGVMSRDGEPEFRLYVFDMFDHYYVDNAFENRLKAAKRVADQAGVYVTHVPHKLIKTIAELDEYEAKQLLAGFEGVMIRDPRGPYKHGRSTMREGWLGKIKRFADSEAVVIGFVEQMHNGNEAKKDALGRTERSSHKANLTGKNTLGALMVRDNTSGVEFEIGTGFDDMTRQRIWASQDYWLGLTVKYKYQPTGVKDKPRFPVFLGERDAIDH